MPRNNDWNDFRRAKKVSHYRMMGLTSCSKMRFSSTFSRTLGLGLLLVATGNNVRADDPATGDAVQGKTLYQQNCALCHSDIESIVKQGPSMIDIFNRKAAAGAGFSYSKGMTDSGLTWDAPTLDKFLANPQVAVPGTTMPVSMAAESDRRDIIAYLKTLHHAAAPAATPTAPKPDAVPESKLGDWREAKPGKKYHFTVADMPPPFATSSTGNGPRVVKPPEGAAVAVPEGFTAKIFASGLSNPRLLRVAPNGDIFLSETGARRVRVLRAADGAETPTENQIFAEGLDRPFGIAFYPPGKDPKWVYVANNNSVVRFAYHNGDMKATAAPEVIVPKLTNGGGGHSTRDVVFSLDGKRMFIAVGSGSNVAQQISRKSVEDAQKWDAEHGKGATWDSEENRADILVTDPEGKQPLHTFATGIRNGVGLAVDPSTGELWVSTNERDGLGDDLVPEYVTRVKEGGYYGWPWYYMGNHEDPRLAGSRPDLAGQAIVPDVLIQSHSASLQMCFYTETKGVAAFPAEYNGDAFAALHGSWNRHTRTGYKVVRIRVVHGVATGEYEDFLTGFVVDDKSVWGRPVGVTMAHDGALLVTEDGNGTLWRVAPVAH